MGWRIGELIIGTQHWETDNDKGVEECILCLIKLYIYTSSTLDGGEDLGGHK